MKVIAWISVLLMTLLIITSSITTKAQVNDEDILKNLIVKQNQASREADYEMAATVWAHKPHILRITAGTGVMTGWDEIGGRYKRIFSERSPSPNAPEPDFTNYQFIVKENMALVYFDQEQVFQTGVQAYTWKSLQIRGFEKIDGEWKMNFQYSGDSPFIENAQEETNARSLVVDLWENAQYEKCADVLHLMEAWYPESSRVRGDLGGTYLAMNDTTKALKYFQEAVDMNPTFDRAKEMVKKLSQQ